MTEQIIMISFAVLTISLTIFLISTEIYFTRKYKKMRKN